MELVEGLNLAAISRLCDEGGEVAVQMQLPGVDLSLALHRLFDGYLSQLWAGYGWTSLPWLPRLTAPTLVLTGDDDPIIPTVNGRILANRIPDARLQVIKGGGHLFLLEEAATCATLIDEFLSEE